MNSVDSRKYKGATFGFSVSVPPEGDPDWPGYYGERHEVINRYIFAEASNFLFEGGRLVFGHRWKGPEGGWEKHGVLNHLVQKSRDFRGFRPEEPDAGTGKVPPAILNLLAWPDLPPPESEKEPHELIREGVLEIRQVRPSGFEQEFLDQAVDAPTAEALLKTPEGHFARIRALTAMRREMVELTDFRICLGGDFGKAARRLPGVIEEALLACHAGKPLYISSAFGGAAKALADCLLQREVRPEAAEMFFTPDPMVELMTTQAAGHPPVEAEEGPSTRDGWNAFAWFQALPLDELAKRAGLETEQFINLLATPNIDRAMAWITGGVANLLRRE